MIFELWALAGIRRSRRDSHLSPARTKVAFEMETEIQDAIHHNSSGDETSWNQAMNAAASSEFKRRLMKDAILGAVALISVLAFVNWPQSWVVVVGVVLVISVAWLSESRSKSVERWPASGRAVFITGCETG
jgi:hypothetical protein